MANCPHCGSEVGDGARFCETCGQPVAVAPATTVIAPGVTPPPGPPVSSPTRVVGLVARGYRFWLNVVTLVGAIVLVAILPIVLDTLFSQFVRDGVMTRPELQSAEDLVVIASVVTVVVAGLSMILVVFTSTASLGRRVTGGLLGLAFVGIGVPTAIDPFAFVQFFFGYFNSIHLLLVLLLFFAWSISRPFRGPGYFSLLVGVPVLFALGYVPDFGWRFGLGSEVVRTIFWVLAVGAILLSLWVAVWFEARPPRVTPSASGGYASAQGQPGAAGYAPRTNVPAVISLVFGILGGSVVAIVLGHISLSQTRRTGEGGRRMAIAGLVLGYAGLLVAAGYLAFVITTLF